MADTKFKNGVDAKKILFHPTQYYMGLEFQSCIIKSVAATINKVISANYAAHIYLQIKIKRSGQKAKTHTQKR
jgi:hypothetical protein